MNALDEELEGACDLELVEGDSPMIAIRVIDDSEICQIILKTILIQLKTIEEVYSQYLTIREMEV